MNDAVDRSVGCADRRCVVPHRAPRMHHELGATLLLITIVVDDLTGEPVVADLVIVPDREKWNCGGCVANLGGEVPVFVRAPEVGERLRDVRLRLGDDVLPCGAVGELDRGLDRPIGVDAIAAMDEELWSAREERRVSGHASALWIDAPALTVRVAGPCE